MVLVAALTVVTSDCVPTCRIVFSGFLHPFVSVNALLSIPLLPLPLSFPRPSSPTSHRAIILPGTVPFISSLHYQQNHQQSADFWTRSVTSHTMQGVVLGRNCDPGSTINASHRTLA